MSAKILIVDDEELIRWSLSQDLTNSGYKTVVAADLAEAEAALEAENPDVVLSDLRLGRESGLDVLKSARRGNPELPVIIMTAFADLASAVEALREGAADYISKPLQLAGLKITLKRVLETAQLKRRLDRAHQKGLDKYNFASIVAESPSMKDALAVARKISASPFGTVLILGESGCGKDRLARAIHYGSPRAFEPFMEISCTAIPDNLLESELFGYEKGSFTGAVGQKKGLFEIANGGTIFLNEIGHMPMALQGKILRALEDKTFKRVGGRDDITVDVRVIAATNEDLPRAVSEGRFRQDLYYRINVLTISLLPLRQRKEDILPLMDRLLGKLSAEMLKPKPVLSPETLEQFQAYKWPGNVRELRNVLERMMILDELEFHPVAAAQPAHIARAQAAAEAPTPAKADDAAVTLPPNGIRLEDVEKDLVVQALKRSGGNQQKAAQSLGLSRDALRRRMEKFGLKEAIGALLMLAFLAGAASAEGWFGKSAPKDKFRSANEEKAKPMMEKAGAHSPVKSGECSKCHADPKDPAKLTMEQKPLCLSCHAGKAADMNKATVHSAFKDMDCSTCHQPHASDNAPLLNSPVNELCATCHDPKDAAISKAHFGVSAFEGKCTDCHEPHASKSPKLIVEAKEHIPFGSRSCEMCHAKTGADGKTALKKLPEESCFVCHSNFRKLGASVVVHQPFSSGDCTTCHNPHVSKRASLVRKPLGDVCFGCHDADALKDSHPVSRHPTAKEGKADPRREGKPFDCASCHEPHAGKNPKLMRGDIFTLCAECHKK
ncbi:MAG: sigma 54-interacting transcriptional regulator [Elusimicrobia bacterium]|nr:sigma 54-interacting transcriptional regulator [Elusimicrobiota bacterium]